MLHDPHRHTALKSIENRAPKISSHITRIMLLQAICSVRHVICIDISKRQNIVVPYSIKPSNTCILKYFSKYINFRPLQWRHNESKITGVSIVCLTVCSDADPRKTSKLHVTVWGESTVTGGFPSQRASNAENVSIWRCHHMKITWLYSHYCSDNFPQLRWK